MEMLLSLHSLIFMKCVEMAVPRERQEVRQKEEEPGVEVYSCKSGTWDVETGIRSIRSSSAT